MSRWGVSEAALTRGRAAITAELLRRGYTAEDIRRILGENWLRVCRQVWP